MTRMALLSVDPLETIGVVAAAALGAVGTWAAQRVLGKAAFQNAITTGFDVLSTQLRTDNRELRETLAAQRKECAEELAQLRGELVNAQTIINSLANILRRNGLIDIPEARHTSPPMVTLTGDDEPPKVVT